MAPLDDLADEDDLLNRRTSDLAIKRPATDTSGELSVKPLIVDREGLAILEQSKLNRDVIE